MTGLLTGTVVTIVWERTPALEPLIYELIPAFGAALLATVVISKLTRPPPDTEVMLRIMATGERNAPDEG